MPVGHENLIARMRARGLRLTEQRLVIAALLEEAREHLDAEELYRRAKRRDPRIHRATVYRTLNTLKRSGLVDELDLMHVAGDRHYYEIRPTAFHIHLVCVACGSVAEPSGPFWEDLKRRVRHEAGFEPDIARIEMSGRCAACTTYSTESTVSI